MSKNENVEMLRPVLSLVETHRKSKGELKKEAIESGRKSIQYQNLSLGIWLIRIHINTAAYAFFEKYDWLICNGGELLHELDMESHNALKKICSHVAGRGRPRDFISTPVLNYVARVAMSQVTYELVKKYKRMIFFGEAMEKHLFEELKTLLKQGPEGYTANLLVDDIPF